MTKGGAGVARREAPVTLARSYNPSLAAIAILFAATSLQARTISTQFSAANFSDPLAIDNTYFPLVPGTTFTYEATTKDGCEADVMTVTNDTRVIDGVTTRVVHDQVFEGDSCTTAPSALAEDTLDYYAQDNAGNVWYFGEDSFDCEGAGNCTLSDTSWIAGASPPGALPGIVMLANPQSGDTYYQEQAADVALDQATVTAVGVTARSTRDDAYRSSYSNCIVTKEFTTLEKGEIGFKTYCPNIGIVFDIDHHGPILRSELVSVSSSANALKFRTVPKQ